MNLSGTARSMLQLMWARWLQASGCLWWAKRQLRRRGAVLVLTFHRVLDNQQIRGTCSLPGIVVRQRTFRSLVKHVAAHFDAVSFSDALQTQPGSMRMMITFDDGWKDTYANALPVMHAHGIPATVFVCPGLMGRTLPFWPEVVASLLARATPPVSAVEIETLIETLKTYSTKRREQVIAGLGELHAPAAGEDSDHSDRTVSWEEIREMNAAGVDFGCHTHTHQILTHVPAFTARREIHESKSSIEAALDRRCDLFAYPNGNSSPETRRMLVEEGFCAAFTTERGAWTSDTDRMAIPRLNVCESSVVGLLGRFSPTMFQYSVFWRAWRAVQGERRAPKARRKPVLSEV